MRTRDEIWKTPVGLLTDEEIDVLVAEGQTWARAAKARIEREKNCPGHEVESTETRADAQRGWHPARCRHCGMDMSVDSGG